jgi:adenylosuccinate synthase
MAMKTAHAVIGSGYGDEGKGLMTDYLAFREAVPAVVRTNGGAQAGHSVQTPDGRRHVFHHIASGALAGAATHLSQFFVSHPLFFMRERKVILDLGGNTAVSIDPRSIVTTPYDMMINQVMENSRGGARHGSCGMGFGEAIERNLNDEFALAVGDFEKGADHIRETLDRIRMEWIPERLARLGVDTVPDLEADLLASADLVERFIGDCASFWNAISVRSDATLGSGVLFEGAQGLLLDQDYGAFPHVTRSNTGLKNMVSVAREAGIGRIDVTYMTRAYATRHGAGPFGYEDAQTPWLSMVDPTNQPNDWQGTIRTAPLDVDAVSSAIRHDLGFGGDGVEVSASIGISCVDQVADRMQVGVGGKLVEIDRARLSDVVMTASGLEVSRLSFGPTRADIIDLAPAVASAA